MITFILPGYSLHNKEWLEECAETIKTDGFIRPIFWDHWTDPNEKFDPEEKAELITKHTKGEKINIIAKSIGTYVASLVINKIPDQVNKVIFCGIPLKDIDEERKHMIKKTLESLKDDQIICIQNDNDPHGNYEELKNFLSNNVKVVSKESSTHDYPYFSEFNNYLTS